MIKYEHSISSTIWKFLSKFQYTHIIDKYNIIKTILIENYAILIEHDFNAKSKYTLVNRKIKRERQIERYRARVAKQ